MDFSLTWFFWILGVLFVGALFGVVVGLFIAHFRSLKTKSELSLYQARVADASILTQNLETERQLLLTQIHELSIELGSARARSQTLEEARNTLKAELEVLASEILEDKSRRFSEQNREQIGQLLAPLSERLAEFKNQLRDSSGKENEARAALAAEVRMLSDLNKTVSREAQNLAHALKGDSKTRGNWGEAILVTLLEKSGLVLNQNFRTQVAGTNDVGRRLLPDIVVDLPENRHVIIDSKVSLNAYERWCNAENDAIRKVAAKEHADSVRTHIDQLSKKNYPAIKEINSPEFVFMFVPIEPALTAAMEISPDLVEFAIERRIALVTASSIAPTMRVIAQMWRQDSQNRFARQIAEQGGKLYDKFAAFCQDLEAIGKRIQQTQESYDLAINKLRDGRGNILRQTEKLRELGAKTTASLPVNSRDSDEV